jgi:CRP-like cAMP-binding protein
MLSEKQQQVVKATPWFASLSQDVQADFLCALKLIELKRGSNLYRKGDQGLGFHCVLSGRVAISNVDQSGKKLLLAQLESGSWFGEISMFDGKGRTHDTDADTDLALAFIRRDDFHHLLKQHPSSYLYFAQLLCQKIRSAFSYIDTYSTLTLKQQLAKRLVLLSNNFGQQQTEHANIEVSASQESLAMMISSSRQTVNKLLKELEGQRLLKTMYRKITILDLAALKDLCDWQE